MKKWILHNRWPLKVVVSSVLPVLPKLKLPRTIPQEAPIDPCWDGSLDGGGDGIRGLLHRLQKRGYALQPLARRTFLPAGNWGEEGCFFISMLFNLCQWVSGSNPTPCSQHVNLEGILTLLKCMYVTLVYVKHVQQLNSWPHHPSPLSGILPHHAYTRRGAVMFMGLCTTGNEEVCNLLFTLAGTWHKDMNTIVNNKQLYSS